MYPFAHLGLGTLMADSIPRYRKKPLPLVPLIVGTQLPDLIDKTVYYGLSWSTGLKGAELGFIAGTRNLAHTALFFLLLFGFSRLTKSTKIWALAIGTATHLFLDNLMDVVLSHAPENQFRALLWPLLDWQFPVIPYHDLTEQLSFWASPIFLIFEIIGIFAFIWVLKTRRHRLKPF